MKKKPHKKAAEPQQKKTSSYRELTLALLSGLLCVASFPRLELFPLAWVALIPLFFALANATPRQAFLRGWLFGMVHTIGICYWVFYAMHANSNAGFMVSLFFLVVVIGGGIGLYLAFFALGAGRIMRRGGAGLIQALAIAGIWVAVEYLRANLFTGIPWAQLGHSQYRWTGLIQVCDITGVYGISFLIVMVNYSLFRAIKCLSDRRACLACLVPAAGLVAAVLIYGSLRLPQFNSEDAPGPLTIAAIQGSVPQDQKWRNGNKARIMETHLGLTEKALKQGARLFIWPETTVQTYLQQKVPAPLTKLLRTYDAAAIVGGPRFAGGPENYTYYNSAYYLKGSGIDAIHNKRHLFPFGEYFPLGFVDILKLRYSAPRQYTPGEAITLFETPAGRAAVLICFEVIFSRLARDAVSAGADYLVIISNDAWFGKTSAHYQHFSMAVFTAVGFRRPLVRAANTGISGFIDPAGRIVERLAPFEEGIVLCEPQVNISVISFYCRFGDLFAWLCFLGFLGVFLPLTRTSK